jgi:hypothetical protein
MSPIGVNLRLCPICQLVSYKMQSNGEWLEGSRFRVFSPFSDRQMAGDPQEDSPYVAVKNLTQPYIVDTNAPTIGRENLAPTRLTRSAPAPVFFSTPLPIFSPAVRRGAPQGWPEPGPRVPSPSLGNNWRNGRSPSALPWRSHC